MECRKVRLLWLAVVKIIAAAMLSMMKFRWLLNARSLAMIVSVLVRCHRDLALRWNWLGWLMSRLSLLSKSVLPQLALSVSKLLRETNRRRMGVPC
ncbi:hypothetical protein Pan189_27510 [Stratiformator vulcanicus]|uniref:Uncharacterized protein n=1 Tax=Stratiformator vulcanicus TaxID=2527980 RepID=A0A517R3A0_9PLAN|nr:hypothetical protein Pan189_27510 [Stratiformator vulcanicus]